MFFIMYMLGGIATGAFLFHAISKDPRDFDVKPVWAFVGAFILATTTWPLFWVSVLVIFINRLCRGYTKMADPKDDPDTPNLNELRGLAKRLVALLNNPEPGIQTWREQLKDVLFQIRKF